MCDCDMLLIDAAVANALRDVVLSCRTASPSPSLLSSLLLPPLPKRFKFVSSTTSCLRFCDASVVVFYHMTGPGRS